MHAIEGQFDAQLVAFADGLRGYLDRQLPVGQPLLGVLSVEGEHAPAADADRQSLELLFPHLDLVAVCQRLRFEE